MSVRLLSAQYPPWITKNIRFIIVLSICFVQICFFVGAPCMFEQLIRDGKKRDFQVQNILLQKISWQCSIWLLRPSLAPYYWHQVQWEGRAKASIWGGRPCSAPLRPGFAGATLLQKQENDPLYWETSTGTISGEYQIVNVNRSLFNTQVLLQSNLDQWISKKQEL